MIVNSVLVHNGIDCAVIVYQPDFVCNLLFIGNVGDNNALADVVKAWARPSRLSTKALLLVWPIYKVIICFYLDIYLPCFST